MTEDTKDGGGRHGSSWRIAAWGTAGLILLVPLVAMQFSDEVNWDVTDFAIFGAMLAGVGFAFELVTRKTGNTAYRIAVGFALASTFLLIWINGAVGIIGSEDNDANLMYGGVLAVGIIGAIIARFRARGMARAMFATALAQALVAVIALIWGLGSGGPIWPRGILIMTAFFTVLWLISAWLFWRSETARPSAEGESENQESPLQN